MFRFLKNKISILLNLDIDFKYEWIANKNLKIL